MNPSETADPIAWFRDRRILVTGGRGYLGTELVRRLEAIPCAITRMGRNPPPPGTGLPPGPARIVDLCGNAGDPQIWDRALGDHDVIFHLAAQTSAYQAEADPLTDWTQNVLPMMTLLEACRRHRRQPAVVFASTATICGLTSKWPVDESYPDRPVTIYDLHKSIAEQYLRCYADRAQVQGVSLRLANVYGPGLIGGHQDRGMLNRMIRRALAGEPLTVYKPGSALRDFVYIQDAVQALLLAAMHAQALNARHFLIGSGQGWSIAEALQQVAQAAGPLTGHPVEVQLVDPPPGLLSIEQRNFVADSRAFRQSTGWNAATSLDEGILKTLDWLRGRQGVQSAWHPACYHSPSRQEEPGRVHDIPPKC